MNAFRYIKNFCSNGLCLFNSLFKVLFIFHSHYFFAIGHSEYLAFDVIYHQISTKLPISTTLSRWNAGKATLYEAITLCGVLFQNNLNVACTNKKPLTPQLLIVRSRFGLGFSGFTRCY